MRQVQLVIGVLALTGSVLALTVDKNFAIVPAILGAGLTLAGSTGWCGLAILLSKMPWNKVGVRLRKRHFLFRLNFTSNRTAMFLRQITDSSLAQNAYLIGCQRTGEAIIIDPERDLDRYLRWRRKTISASPPWPTPTSTPTTSAARANSSSATEPPPIYQKKAAPTGSSSGRRETRRCVSSSTATISASETSTSRRCSHPVTRRST